MVIRITREMWRQRSDSAPSSMDYGTRGHVPFLPVCLLPTRRTRKIPQGTEAIYKSKRVKFPNHEEVGLDIQLPLGFLATG